VPGRKVKVNAPPFGLVDGTEIKVVESTVRTTDVKLDDGTVLHLSPIIMSVIRLDGRYDPEGNQMYAVQAGQAMTAEVPEHLRQGAGGPKVQ